MQPLFFNYLSGYLSQKRKKASLLSLPDKPLFGKALLVILISFLGLSCSTEKIQTSFAGKYHLYNVVDISGTTRGSGWPAPPREFYEAQLNWLEGTSGGGTLHIDNTSMPIPEELSVNVLPLVEEPDGLEVGESEVERIRKCNDSVRAVNAANKKTFLDKLGHYIIKYAVSEGNDYSYLDKHVYALSKQLKLPSNSESVQLVFLYTDMRNHEPGRKESAVDSTLIEALNTSRATIFLCSLMTESSENAAIKNLKCVRLGSFNDFIDHLNYLTTKN